MVTMVDTQATDQRRYEFVLPPGWVRIDLRVPYEDQVGSLLDLMVAQGGGARDDARPKLAASKQLLAVCARAKESQVLDLVLPTQRFDGRGLNCSFGIAPFPGVPNVDPLEAMASVASRDQSASLVEIEDLVALRTRGRRQKDADAFTDQVEELAAEVGAEVLSAELRASEVWAETVRYMIGHPDRPDDWIVVDFHTTDGGTPESKEITDALVELFDAIMETMRFSK